MAIGSGLSSQLGFAPEVTYGTFVAPTKFVPVSTFDVKPVSNRIQGQGIRPGGLLPLGALHGETHKAATGQATFEVTNRGLGVLWNTLMGGTVAPAQQGGTPAYLADFPLADTHGKSVTMQGGVPFAVSGGTVNPHTLLGGKITAAEFSCSVGQLLTCNLTLDGRSFDTAQVLATASYATGLAVFTWQQATVKLGSYGAETAISGVKGFSLRINRPHDTEKYYVGGGALKSQPVKNAFDEVSGSLNVDFIDSTLLGFFTSVASKSLIIEFVGAQIQTTYYDTIRFTLPQVQFVDAGVPVGGQGTVAQTIGFTATDDGTNAMKLTTINKDTAL